MKGQIAAVARAVAAARDAERAAERPQPPDGPAISGAMLTIGDTTWVRHGGLWVPLLIPRPDFDALVDAAFEPDFEEGRAT